MGEVVFLRVVPKAVTPTAVNLVLGAQRVRQARRVQQALSALLVPLVQPVQLAQLVQLVHKALPEPLVRRVFSPPVSSGA